MKSYTDIEQSKKLAEILPLESADMYYRDWKIMTEYIRIAHVGSAGEKDLPCWSLAALFGVLSEYTYTLENNKFYGKVALWCQGTSVECDNPVDACYETIIKLHELKML